MYSFVSPMLAGKVDTTELRCSGPWAVEEKLDGHRLIVGVEDGSTRAWSRDGRDRVLPPHVREGLAQLPNGLYDGELMVPGSRSYGVTELKNIDKLVYVVFDLLCLFKADLTVLGNVDPHKWSERRDLLEEMFVRSGLHSVGAIQSVRLSPVLYRGLSPDIEQLSLEVWSRGGEGLIIKRENSIYHPGKRSRLWMKVKQLRTALMTVVEFVPGLMGPCATLLLRDAEGFETTVKARNQAELMAMELNPSAYIGRKLHIEFQERTPDGSYRHPRWDRWEDPSEVPEGPVGYPLRSEQEMPPPAETEEDSTPNPSLSPAANPVAQDPFSAFLADCAADCVEGE